MLSMRNIYYGTIIAYVIYTLFLGVLSVNPIPGIYIFSNRSNSMSPTITTGDLIIVRRQAYYQVGDVISYYAIADQRQTIMTHRVVATGGNVYTTKGDANAAIDQVVVPRLIIGKVTAVIPYIGALVQTAKSGLGVVMTIILPAFAIILIEGYTLMKYLRT